MWQRRTAATQRLSTEAQYSRPPSHLAGSVVAPRDESVPSLQRRGNDRQGSGGSQAAGEVTKAGARSPHSRSTVPPRLQHHRQRDARHVPPQGRRPLSEVDGTLCGSAPAAAPTTGARARLVEGAVGQREDVRPEHFEEGEVALSGVRQLVLRVARSVAGRAGSEAGCHSFSFRIGTAYSGACPGKSTRAAFPGKWRRGGCGGLGRRGWYPLPCRRAGRLSGRRPRRHDGCCQAKRPAVEHADLQLVDKFPERPFVGLLHHRLVLNDLVQQALQRRR